MSDRSHYAFPSYSEMAKRNLPASYKATDSFDKDLKEWTSVFEKANIARSTLSHRSPLRRLAATPSDLKLWSKRTASAGEQDCEKPPGRTCCAGGRTRALNLWTGQLWTTSWGNHWRICPSCLELPKDQNNGPARTTRLYLSQRYQNYGWGINKKVRGWGTSPLETVRGRMSLPSSKTVISGPDLHTAGELPRYDIWNDHMPMKIALWYVNGAARKEEEINAMMRSTNANCGITSETWLCPDQTLNCPWKTLRTDDLPRPGRPAGGVAILLPQNMGAKIVRRYVQDELNAVWVGIPNSADTAAVYVRPGAEREAFRCFMEDVRRRARFPFVMAGNFNARHKVWCTKNNPERKDPVWLVKGTMKTGQFPA